MKKFLLVRESLNLGQSEVSKAGSNAPVVRSTEQNVGNHTVVDKLIRVLK